MEHSEASARRAHVESEDRGVFGKHFDASESVESGVDERHQSGVYEATGTGRACLFTDILCL